MRIEYLFKVFGIIANKKLALLLLGMFLITLPSIGNATPVFDRLDDFNSGAPVGWSSSTTAVVAGQTILGRFGNGTISLNVALPSHDEATLEFDFWTIDTWDGTGAGVSGGFCCGPDRFTAAITGGPTIVDSTFSNHRFQNFPDSFGGGSFAPLTGAAEVVGGGAGAEVRWHFSETFAHTGLFSANFTASGLQGLGDESWGLDNVHIVAASTSAAPVPEPSTMLLLGSGLIGLVGYNFRHRKQVV